MDEGQQGQQDHGKIHQGQHRTSVTLRISEQTQNTRGQGEQSQSEEANQENAGGTEEPLIKGGRCLFVPQLIGYLTVNRIVK